VRNIEQAVVTPSVPRVYSVAKTLTWALIGAGIFSGGILSCRLSSDTASASTSQTNKLLAPEYTHGTGLSVKYRPDSDAPMALVAYSPHAPELTVLADDDHSGKKIQQVSPCPTVAGINPDTLRMEPGYYRHDNSTYQPGKAHETLQHLKLIRISALYQPFTSLCLLCT